MRYFRLFQLLGRCKKNLHIQDDVWAASLHLYLQCFFSSEYFLGTHIFRASFLNFAPLSFRALELVKFPIQDFKI